LNGDSAYHPSLEEMTEKPAKALKNFESWLKTFDAEEHYQRRIKDQIRAYTNKIEALKTF
jgi:hypothetical protein